MRILLLSLCFVPMAFCSVVTSVTVSCVMDNGYSDTFASSTIDNTCSDPDVANSLVTFSGWANSSITPQGTMVSEGVYSSYDGIPCYGSTCDYWTTVSETVTISEQEYWVASGGTGQGTIEGICYGSGGGTGSTSFGSDCSEGGSAFAPISFTFGQPFALSGSVTVTTTGATPNDVEWFQNAVTTAVLDANGGLMTGVVFVDPAAPAVPEPESAWLIVGGLIFVVAGGLRRRYNNLC